MLKNYAIRITAILSFILLVALFSALSPVQASESPNVGLQDTPAPTIIVPTVIIPDTGGDDTPAATGFFASWMFWSILVLIILALMVSLVGRSRTVPPPTHHHDHSDEM
jgi:hypothetical protein